MVKQARVLRNVLMWGALCAIVLWCVRAQLWQSPTAVLLGVVAGSLYACRYWRRLSRRIARRDRRFKPNKIFVHDLNAVELLLRAIAYNPSVTMPMAIAFIAIILFAAFSDAWWAILVGTFGVVNSGVLAAYIMRYERRHGPLHYQYESRMWSGAEGMLYRPATVVKPLTPVGKVDCQGELWDAVALSGAPIDVGERVEVISVEHLTLYVDRLPQPGSAAATDVSSHRP